VDVPVEPGMIHENLQTTADQQNQEEKIHIMSDAQPYRKSLRLSSQIGLKAVRKRRETDDGPLPISRGN
jgi:hypothetical protein